MSLSQLRIEAERVAAASGARFLGVVENLRESGERYTEFLFERDGIRHAIDTGLSIEQIDALQDVTSQVEVFEGYLGSKPEAPIVTDFVTASEQFEPEAAI